jgi:glycosyltransferase involved in cell wall biosynthesis
MALPAYNSERYISKSIESLLGQTYGDFELVISDNASTDGTEEICRRYAASDKRVRYVRRPDNIGGPANFRYVFSLCTGEYHKWAAADDYSHPDFLQKAVAVLDQQPDVVLCYPKTRIVDANGETISDYDEPLHLVDDSPRVRYRELYTRIGLCNAPYGLMRRDAMQKTRLIARHLTSDVDFLGEMALLGKFWVLPEVGFYRRFHPTASSWARGNNEHQRQYYDPSRKRGPGLQTWRRLQFQFGVIWRSQVSLGDKVALSNDVARRARYERHALSRELLECLSFSTNH